MFENLSFGKVCGLRGSGEISDIISLMKKESRLAKPSENRVLSELAAKMYMSTSYFQHLYKELFATTFNADIIRARTDKAAALLMYGEYSVSDIANMCGYNSTEHFIRQFSKLYGMTPDKYRRSEHGK